MPFRKINTDVDFSFWSVSKLCNLISRHSGARWGGGGILGWGGGGLGGLRTQRVAVKHYRSLSM